MAKFKSRPDTRIIPTQFTAILGKQPYKHFGMRAKSGLKRTAFHDVIGHAKEFHIHNTYLKPDVFTDPLEEYWHIRNSAGLIDVTGEEVIEVTGPDSLDLVNDLMPRDVKKLPDQKAFYSVLCHANGGIVEDGIFVRFNERKFWWVGGPGNAEELLYSNIGSRDVELQSYNDKLHVASVQGPLSRDILNSVCERSLQNVPPFGLLRADLCGVPVTITRTGYTAELGYDIYVDVEYGPKFFVDLKKAVEAAGGGLAGSHSLNIRRIEAGILNFGFDFDWQHTPVDVGLTWMISETKGPYQSREALVAAKQKNPENKFVGFVLEGHEVPLSGDKVVLDGEVIGLITSSTGSPALGKPIAMGYIAVEQAIIGKKVQIDCGGKLKVARVADTPFIDRERNLMKA